MICLSWKRPAELLCEDDMDGNGEIIKQNHPNCPHLLFCFNQPRKRLSFHIPSRLILRLPKKESRAHRYQIQEKQQRILRKLQTARSWTDNVNSTARQRDIVQQHLDSYTISHAPS